MADVEIEIEKEKMCHHSLKSDSKWKRNAWVFDPRWKLLRQVNPEMGARERRAHVFDPDPETVEAVICKAWQEEHVVIVIVLYRVVNHRV
jgi:hypothetical protein